MRAKADLDVSGGLRAVCSLPLLLEGHVKDVVIVLQGSQLGEVCLLRLLAVLVADLPPFSFRDLQPIDLIMSNDLNRQPFALCWHGSTHGLHP